MAPCMGVCAPRTAEAAKPHEGALDTSVDTESMDASVRLKAMEQEQYGLEEYLYLVLFNQQYSERIAAERVTIPTVDALQARLSRRQPRFGGKTIAQDAGPYIDVSPLNHVEDIQTPLLVHATSGDKTAPVQLHSGRLIELLRAHNKVFESKIYDHAPGGHVFSEVDSPDARDSQDRIFEFLAKYTP
jgi:hypothetical protein